MQRLGRRFGVAALDPRGQGDSEVPDHGYDIDRRAEDIAEFVAFVQPSVLVAWSLGALETLQYVHRHGEESLRGLVIVDSSVGEPPAPPDASGWRKALERNRSVEMEAFVRGLFAKPRPEAEIQALRVQALRMPLAASLALFPSHLPREHWRGIVEGFSKPLLYAVTPQFEAQASALARQRPATRVEIFREAGHALFVDEPARFASVVSEFAAPLS